MVHDHRSILVNHPWSGLPRICPPRPRRVTQSTVTGFPRNCFPSDTLNFEVFYHFSLFIILLLAPPPIQFSLCRLSTDPDFSPQLVSSVIAQYFKILWSRLFINLPGLSTTQSSMSPLRRSPRPRRSVAERPRPPPPMVDYTKWDRTRRPPKAPLLQCKGYGHGEEEGEGRIISPRRACHGSRSLHVP